MHAEGGRAHFPGGGEFSDSWVVGRAARRDSAGGQELGSVQEQECGSWCLFKESAMEKPAQLSLFMKDGKQTSLG